jgi:quercetin dioxygenase-like cupin family protein
MSASDPQQDPTTATSGVWHHLVPVVGTPDGFTVRTTYPTNADGAEVMLEGWRPGTEEPAHSHPGDDMTIVVEGRMSVQFYRREGGRLAPDGDRVVLEKGDVGYIRAGRIHDARYEETCRLVYVHDGAFAFIPAEAAGE